jgi:hypothetical protein
VNAVDRADVDAARVFDADARLGDHVGHGSGLAPRARSRMPFESTPVRLEAAKVRP